MRVTTGAALESLDRLVGSWITEATHDHPDFPDSISIIGFTDVDRVASDALEAAADGSGSGPRMHYYDSRGVSRVYELSIDAEALRIWRDAPGFSHRFEGRFVDGGETIVGQWQLCEHGVHWNDDLKIIYRRQ